MDLKPAKNILKPIFLQPSIDLPRNEIKAVFVDESSPRLYSVVFAGEDAVDACSDQICDVATTFYKAYNKVSWGRMADIERFHIAFSNGKPNKLRLDSFSKEQTWFHGDAKPFVIPDDTIPRIVGKVIEDVCGRIPKIVQFEDSYSVDFDWDNVETVPSGRPMIYVNTPNHLFGVKNNNEGMKLTAVSDYAFYMGGDADAEDYARKHIDHEPNELLEEAIRIMNKIRQICLCPV